MFKKIIAASFILSTLSACGGGGGGSSGVVSMFTPVDPSPVSQSDLQTGTPSTNTGRDTSQGIASVALTYTDDAGITRTTSSQSEVLFSQLHLGDTNAASAWANGWTGLGTRIAIIDDFQNKDIERKRGMDRSVVWRDGTSAWYGDGTYDVAFNIVTKHTHGELVANIAGGSGAAVTDGNIQINAVSETRTSCTGGYCYGPYVYSSFRSYDDLDDTVTLTYSSVDGIAKEATMLNNHVDLSGRTSAQSVLTAIAGHLDNARNFDVVNMSIGYLVNTSGVSLSDVVNSLDSSVLQYNTDAVVVVAGGNSGAPCTSSDLGGCNALAVAAMHLPQTKANSIVVGATTGTGNSETLASYSVRAGALKNRFMLASGDTGNNQIQGTSFAAPRVAGAAAILRHKFPNLNGAKASNILLLTSNKDIDNNGIDDFSGVSDTYGHGKLDLMAALSPVGSLAVR